MSVRNLFVHGVKIENVYKDSKAINIVKYCEEEVASDNLSSDYNANNFYGLVACLNNLSYLPYMRYESFVKYSNCICSTIGSARCDCNSLSNTTNPCPSGGRCGGGGN